MERRSVRVGERDVELRFDDLYGANLAKVFDPGLTAILTCLASPDGLALDVGANIGVTSLLLAQHAQLVHAFEIVPSTFRILGENIRTNAVPNVVLHPYGLGDTASRVEVRRREEHRAGAFVDSEGLRYSGHLAEEGELRRLDEIPLEGDVGLIKLDVEGYELRVLRGGSGVLREHHPAVVLEMNHWCLNAFQRTSIPEFLETLRDTFPFLFALDERSGDVRDLSLRDDAYHVMNRHIIDFRYGTLVAGFTTSRLLPALEAFSRSVPPSTNHAVAAVPGDDRGALEAELAVVKATLAQVLGSKSWRLTRPFRRDHIS